MLAQAVAGAFGLDDDGMMQQSQIPPCVLHRREAQRHQLAGRIVDEHPQGAYRAAALEPVMRRAVRLHPLTATGAPLPLRMNLGVPPRPHLPQPGLNHPLAQRLHRKGQAVFAYQILMRQSRPEIRIPLPHKFQRFPPNRPWNPVARHFAPVARDQTFFALLPVTLDQPLDLPRRQI